MFRFTRDSGTINLTLENIHLLGSPYFKAALKEPVVGSSDVVHIYFHSPMALDPYFLDEFLPMMTFARDGLRAQFAFLSSLRPGTHAVGRPLPPAYVAALTPTLLKSFLGKGRLGRHLLGTATMESEAPVRSS